MELQVAIVDPDSTTENIVPSSASEDGSSENGIAYDEMGPIIINTDGTMARIPNWKEMTETEQQQAFRLIRKRNARRKAALQQQETRVTETKDET
jgi:hypothetical protein